MRAAGHNQSVTHSLKLAFEGPLHSETYRMPNECSLGDSRRWGDKTQKSDTSPSADTYQEFSLKTCFSRCAETRSTMYPGFERRPSARHGEAANLFIVLVS